MGYLLRMSGEIHDWLADLQETDPPAAMRVGQALAALMSEGAGLGPPLVVPVAATWPEDLVAALDASYQHRLDRLQVVRRRVAEAAWLVKDIQDQVDELESAQARLDDRRRRALEEGRKDEAEQAAGSWPWRSGTPPRPGSCCPGSPRPRPGCGRACSGCRRRTDAFRTRKELLKATYTAARAELQVNEEMAAAARPTPQATAEAAGRLRDATAQIERELGRQPLPDGLLELRPGAPGDSEIRLIFAVEPPGTALLIAVLEGREAARDQYRDAVCCPRTCCSRRGPARHPRRRRAATTTPGPWPRSSFPARPPRSTPARPPWPPGTAPARWPSSGPGSA